MNCEHKEVEYLCKSWESTFFYRCLDCNRLGEATKNEYIFNRLVAAREGDKFPVYVKRNNYVM